MLIYLIHSREFNRNQYRVLFDWFDFIHRCFFHSRLACPDQYWFQYWIYIIDLFPFNSMNIACSIFLSFFLSLFQTPYHLSLVIDLGSSNPLTLFHYHYYHYHYNSDWFSLHAPILCGIDVKNEDMEFMRNERVMLR